MLLATLCWMATVLVSAAGHPYLCSTEVKNTSLSSSTIHYMFVAWCLVRRRGYISFIVTSPTAIFLTASCYLHSLGFRFCPLTTCPQTSAVSVVFLGGRIIHARAKIIVFCTIWWTSDSHSFRLSTHTLWKFVSFITNGTYSRIRKSNIC